MSAVTQVRAPRARHGQGRQIGTHGPKADHEEKLLLDVVEAARKLGIGRTLMYELLGSGQVSSVRVGRRRKVPSAAGRSSSRISGDGRPTSALQRRSWDFVDEPLSRHEVRLAP